MNERPGILIVEDEAIVAMDLERLLSRIGYRVVGRATTGEDAIRRAREAKPHLILMDVRLGSGIDGIEAARRICESRETPIIFLTAFSDESTIARATESAPFAYVLKPFDERGLRASIEVALHRHASDERLKGIQAAESGRLAIENSRLAERSGEPVEGFVGRSPLITELLRVLVRASAHDSSVLLTGESGTGKELLARAIHRLSARRNGPWVAVNCAAIPEALLESELFGYGRGAFTGAVRDHAGFFEQADGGTLFLDEIGELPPSTQAKFLRTLQEGTLRRLGASVDTTVDVRIVAATAASLTPPRFREDLYYRVAVIHLVVPPLRDHADDIPMLVDHLLSALCARLRLPRPRVTDDAMRVLLGSRWPGNVRQLENALEHALLVSDAETIEAEALPSELRWSPPVTPVGDTLSIPTRTAELERTLIGEALVKHRGNKAAAARTLEVSYKTLLYKVREYGLGET